MKKTMMALMALSLSAALLAGCGDEAVNHETATAEAETQTQEEKVYADESYLDFLQVSDYVELGEYKGLKVNVAAPSVSDAEVESYIEKQLMNNMDKKEITDRAVENGDLTDINFVGKMDGKEFEGGSAENFELSIGSGSFIDGFEDGIIGMKTGETKDLNLTFPDPYTSNPEMSGKDVVFTVTLNKIYEEVKPELNDAFVAGLEIEGVDTVDAYRDYVYEQLMASAQQNYDFAVESEVLKALQENTTYLKTPELMVERYYDRLLNNLTMQAAMYGMDLATFMQYGYGMTAEEYEAEMQNSAKAAVEQVLALQAVAEKEGLQVSDEDVEADMKKSAEEYGYESVDAYKEVLGNEVKGYREYLMTENMTKFVVENAVVSNDVEAAAEETAEEGTTEAAAEETAEEGTTEAAAEETAEEGTTEAATEETAAEETTEAATETAAE